MPLTILPHWSDPPICSRQPGAPRQLEEVVGLEDHVVEFEEGQRLLAVEPQLDAVEGQHPVDREMRADVAQERDVVELVEPVVIVDHDRVGRPVAEGQEALEHPADQAMLASIVLVGEQLAAFVLAATDRRSWSCRRPSARSACARPAAAGAAS